MPITEISPTVREKLYQVYLQQIRDGIAPHKRFLTRELYDPILIEEGEDALEDVLAVYDISEEFRQRAEKEGYIADWKGAYKKVTGEMVEPEKKPAKPRVRRTTSTTTTKPPETKVEPEPEKPPVKKDTKKKPQLTTAKGKKDTKPKTYPKKAPKTYPLRDLTKPQLQKQLEHRGIDFQSKDLKETLVQKIYDYELERGEPKGVSISISPERAEKEKAEPEPEGERQLLIDEQGDILLDSTDPAKVQERAELLEETGIPVQIAILKDTAPSRNLEGKKYTQKNIKKHVIMPEVSEPTEVAVTAVEITTDVAEPSTELEEQFEEVEVVAVDGEELVPEATLIKLQEMDIAKLRSKIREMEKDTAKARASFEELGRKSFQEYLVTSTPETDDELDALMGKWFRENVNATDKDGKPIPGKQGLDEDERKYFREVFIPNRVGKKALKWNWYDFESFIKDFHNEFRTSYNAHKMLSEAEQEEQLKAKHIPIPSRLEKQRDAHVQMIVDMKRQGFHPSILFKQLTQLEWPDRDANEILAEGLLKWKQSLTPVEVEEKEEEISKEMSKEERALLGLGIKDVKQINYIIDMIQRFTKRRPISKKTGRRSQIYEKHHKEMYDLLKSLDFEQREYVLDIWGGSKGYMQDFERFFETQMQDTPFTGPKSKARMSQHIFKVFADEEVKEIKEQKAKEKAEYDKLRKERQEVEEAERQALADKHKLEIEAFQKNLQSEQDQHRRWRRMMLFDRYLDAIDNIDAVIDIYIRKDIPDYIKHMALMNIEKRQSAGEVAKIPITEKEAYRDWVENLRGQYFDSIEPDESIVERLENLTTHPDTKDFGFEGYIRSINTIIDDERDDIKDLGRDALAVIARLNPTQELNLKAKNIVDQLGRHYKSLDQLKLAEHDLGLLDKPTYMEMNMEQLELAADKAEMDDFVPTDITSKEELLLFKKDELQKMAKAKGIKPTGTKDKIADQIIGEETKEEFVDALIKHIRKQAKGEQEKYPPGRMFTYSSRNPSLLINMLRDVYYDMIKDKIARKKKVNRKAMDDLKEVFKDISQHLVNIDEALLYRTRFMAEKQEVPYETYQGHATVPEDVFAEKTIVIKLPESVTGTFGATTQPVNVTLGDVYRHWFVPKEKNKPLDMKSYLKDETAFNKKITKLDADIAKEAAKRKGIQKSEKQREDELKRRKLINDMLHRKATIVYMNEARKAGFENPIMVDAEKAHKLGIEDFPLSAIPYNLDATAQRNLQHMFLKGGITKTDIDEWDIDTLKDFIGDNWDWCRWPNKTIKDTADFRQKLKKGQRYKKHHDELKDCAYKKAKIIQSQAFENMPLDTVEMIVKEAGVEVPFDKEEYEELANKNAELVAELEALQEREGALEQGVSVATEHLEKQQQEIKELKSQIAELESQEKALDKIEKEETKKGRLTTAKKAKDKKKKVTKKKEKAKNLLKKEKAEPVEHVGAIGQIMDKLDTIIEQQERHSVGARNVCFSMDELKTVKTSVKTKENKNKKALDKLKQELKDGEITKAQFDAYSKIMEDEKKAIDGINELFTSLAKEDFLCTPQELSALRGFTEDEVKEEMDERDELETDMDEF